MIYETAVEYVKFVKRRLTSQLLKKYPYLCNLVNEVTECDKIRRSMINKFYLYGTSNRRKHIANRRLFCLDISVIFLTVNL